MSERERMFLIYYYTTTMVDYLTTNYTDIHCECYANDVCTDSVGNNMLSRMPFLKFLTLLDLP